MKFLYFFISLLIFSNSFSQSCSLKSFKNKRTAKKINTNNTHGTGCTISSAIAANLSKGFSLYESVSIAHKYVYKSILKAPNLGSGHGPLNHFHVIPD